MKKRYFLKKFLFYFLIIFLPTAVLASTYFVYSSLQIERSINENTENKYTLGVQYISSTLDVFPGRGSIFNSSSILTRVIKKSLSSDSLSYTESVYSRILTAIINNYANTHATIDSIYLYTENNQGNYIRSGYGLSSLNQRIHTEWLEILRHHDPVAPVWLSRYTSRYYNFEAPRPIISVFYRLASIDGAIIVNMDVTELAHMLDSLATYRNEMIFVTDAEGRYLFGNSASEQMLQYGNDLPNLLSHRTGADTKSLYNVFINEEKYVLLEAEIPSLAIKFHSLTAFDVLYEIPRQMLIFLLIAAGAIAIISLILSYLFSRKGTRQIQSVVSIITAAENGKYLPQKNISKRDDYAFILNNIIDVFIRNSYLRLRVDQLELEKQVAEFRALQLQINPHFLFNTLQSISINALRMKAGEAIHSDTVQNLSDILRYSLEISQPYVTLQDEIAISKKYISIQTERYPHRFFTIWEYDEEALSCSILRLILQPMLENSLQHGILPSSKLGLIKIRIEMTKCFLYVTITDNGIGMSKSETEALRQHVHEDFSRSDRHIGLKNVLMRLKLLYGESVRIHIFSIQNMGTSISLTLPFTSPAQKSTFHDRHSR